MARKKRKYIRKYRTKNQKAALAAALFGGVLSMIIVVIFYSSTNPAYVTSKSLKHQDVILSEAFEKLQR